MNRKILLALLIVTGASLLIHHFSASAKESLAKQKAALADNKLTVVKIVNLEGSSSQLASLSSAPAAQAQPQRGSATKISASGGAPKATVSAKTAVKPSKTSSKTTVKAAVSTIKKSKPTTSIHYTSRYGTTMPWDATSLHYLSNIAAFDYSTSIRSTIIRKIEAYARSHGVKEVSMSMMNRMAESQ